MTTTAVCPWFLFSPIDAPAALLWHSPSLAACSAQCWNQVFHPCAACLCGWTKSAIEVHSCRRCGMQITTAHHSLLSLSCLRCSHRSCCARCGVLLLPRFCCCCCLVHAEAILEACMNCTAQHWAATHSTPLTAVAHRQLQVCRLYQRRFGFCIQPHQDGLASQCLRSRNGSESGRGAARKAHAAASLWQDSVVRRPYASPGAPGRQVHPVRCAANGTVLTADKYGSVGTTLGHWQRCNGSVGTVHKDCSATWQACGGPALVTWD